MLGKTNATVGGSSGGAGGTVTAINKTGAVINKGDKVWLNENVVTGDTSFGFGSDSLSAYANIIHPSGISAVGSGRLYLLEGDTPVATSVTSGNFAYPRYSGPYIYAYNGNSDASSYIYSTNNVINIGGHRRYVENSDGLFVKRSGTTIEKIDIDTGEILQTWTGIQYSLDNMGAYYQYDENTLIIRGSVFTLNSDGTYTYAQTAVEGLSTLNDMFLTKDKKHIVSLYGSVIKIYKIIDATHAEELPENNLPEDLRDLTGYSNFVYNANNDIITLTKNSTATKEFLVIRFNNGNLKKLSFTLPFGGEGEGIYEGATLYQYLYGPMLFSDDMSRALIGLKEFETSSYTRPCIINFSGTTGYIAVPYRVYAVNQDTLTSFANNTALNNAEVEVNTGVIANQDLTITENGVYTADDGYTGIGEVTVNVPTVEVNLQDKTITDNGTYTADEGYTGLGTVTVEVDSVNNETLSEITENGTYTPGEGYTGFNEFTVNVPTSGGATSKYGVTIDNFLGDVDENGVYTAPTENIELNFVGIKKISKSSCKQLFMNKGAINNILYPDLEECETDGLYNAFLGNTSYSETQTQIENFSAPKLKIIQHQGLFCVCKNRKIKKVDLKSLTDIAYWGLYEAFYGCLIEELDISSLEQIGGSSSLVGAFRKNYIKTITFNRLKSIRDSLTNTFADSYAMESMYFPELIEVNSTGALNNMLANTTTEVEIHFRSDMQETISGLTGYAEKFGAANATIYFDL